MTALRTRPTVALAAATSLLAMAPGALAATITDYGTRTFDEPASRGLAVAPPLAYMVAVSRARMIVPKTWRPVATTAGHVKYTLPNSSCTFDVTFTVRSVVADDTAPVDRVAAAVPGTGAYVLDAGQRLGSAFRVVRAPRSDGRVFVNAQRSAVLTRRKDIAPSGKVVWSDLTATARSRKGDECHAGTYRERLGPQLADIMATARTNLRFVRK